MPGLDGYVSGFTNGSLMMGLAVALLLGARHATDPDHLTAVSTLILSDDRRSAIRASVLGLFWGLGHALTLFLFGLPVVFFGRLLPEFVQRGTEFVIGLLIVGLAIRLLIRWRRGHFHAHTHTHGAVRHTHLHVHEHKKGVPHQAHHSHRHADAMGRSPLTSFAIGLVHGAGGSAAAGVLVVAALPVPAHAAIALAAYAGMTAISMALVSSVFGYALVRRAVAPRLESIVPALGTLSLLFGVWYAVAALG